MGTISQRRPVLVIGAGPAGLTAAIALARLGVRVLVVDKRPAPSDLPRATVLSTRTMEIMRDWALDRALLAGGNDVEWQMWAAPSLARAAEGRPLPVGYPTKAQAAAVSPSAPACVPQDHLERVLESHLRTLPAATIVRGRAAGPADVEGAQYVIAADGARSATRAALGISAPGTDDIMDGTNALFRDPLLWRLAGPHRYGIYWTVEAGGILLPSGSGDRWHYGVTPAVPPDRLPSLIERAVGVPGFAPRLERVGTFTSSARLAERYREGNTFLVGDAAHQITPRGGTGLNTALYDGYDLGWKLAWVLRGWASADLLDTYEAERRPVAAHNVARSADPRGSNRTVEEELHIDLGGRVLDGRPGWPDGVPLALRGLPEWVAGPGLALDQAQAGRGRG
ncbi:FAD-dependent monooxygenase [Dactylosporangium sp. NPDC051541]|uniref:FAD-dependent monooxygenase n=1 Tax=Dactylosporangium sp. NPDC051541 TaxID=3363977 RepID=UPI0037A8148D